MNERLITIHHFLCLLLVLVLSGTTWSESYEAMAKDGEWQIAYKARARLVSGGSEKADGASKLAFVQLELEPGWKTYWRHPGDAGGIPPEFSWLGSTNLNSARVLYPAPHRMSEDLGDTIGYKKSVIFPVRLSPKDKTKPIDLSVTFRFGICKDICVPSEVKFGTRVPVESNRSVSLKFLTAIDRVPRAKAMVRPTDPILDVVKAAQNNGQTWRIAFIIKHQVEAKEADLFLEAPRGLYIPVPKRTMQSRDPSRLAYEIVLSDDEYQALKDQTVEATVVDTFGASKTEFVLR